MFVAFHALSSIYLQKSARVIGSNIMALVSIDKQNFFFFCVKRHKYRRNEKADLTEY